MKSLKVLPFITILFTSIIFVSCEEEVITAEDLSGTTWLVENEPESWYCEKPMLVFSSSNIVEHWWAECNDEDNVGDFPSDFTLSFNKETSYTLSNNIIYFEDNYAVLSDSVGLSETGVLNGDEILMDFDWYITHYDLVYVKQ